jgi:hypothetical protein
MGVALARQCEPLSGVVPRLRCLRLETVKKNQATSLYIVWRCQMACGGFILKCCVKKLRF